MAAHYPPVCDFGWKAADFDLPATDGKRCALAAAPDCRALFKAMLQVGRTGKRPQDQTTSIGGSIKWRA